MQTKTSLTAAFLILTTPYAFAGSDSGLYLGASLGNAQVDYSDNDPDIGDVNFDDDDTGYKIFGGFNLGLVPFLNLAVEGAYVDFGSADGEISNVTGNSIDTNGWTAFGLAGFDLGPVGVFGKAGLFAWDSDIKTSAGNFSESGTDPAYGIGAKFQLGSFAVRAEYELFELDEVEVDYFSVGGSFTF